MKTIMTFFQGAFIANGCLCAFFGFNHMNNVALGFFGITIFSGYIALMIMGIRKRTSRNFHTLLHELVERASPDDKIIVIRDADRIVAEMENGAPLMYVAHEIGHLAGVVDEHDLVEQERKQFEI